MLSLLRYLQSALRKADEYLMSNRSAKIGVYHNKDLICFISDGIARFGWMDINL